MRQRGRHGFTLVELLVVVVIVIITAALLLPLWDGPRYRTVIARKAYCANNLAQLLRAVYIYTSEQSFFPPHNPLPGYWPQEHPVVQLYGAGFDPQLGWILTYAMRMTPPSSFRANNHFQWFTLNEDELPDLVSCPDAKRDLMFAPNPELDLNAPWETYAYPYAAFYQTSGVCRSPAAGLAADAVSGLQRNPAAADPTSPATARQVRNAFGGMPTVYVTPAATAAGADDAAAGQEVGCWVQAIQPSEIDDPSRLYHLADSREYRPAGPGQPDSHLPGTTHDGWLVTADRRVVLGTRHRGWANVAYMDGHASWENLVQDPAWNMQYDPRTKQAGGDEWRACTFADLLQPAGLQNQHHLLPVLDVVGWTADLAVMVPGPGKDGIPAATTHPQAQQQ